MKSYKEIEVRFTENPQKSLPVGTLAVKENSLFFEYDTQWLQRDLELSPFSLPLQSGLIQHQDRRYASIFGLFDDSLPDGWGLLLMDRVFRSRNIDPAGISILACSVQIYTASTYLDHTPILSNRMESP